MFSILYVDDEAGLLDIAKLFLESLGQFTIDTVTSAVEAQVLIREKKYDAIISDYQMPEMDGIELLRQVRASGNNIPFILFTGRGREEIVIQALNEGADFYLQKGGDPAALFTELAYKIRQAVNRRSAELALKNSEKRLADIINFLPDATFAIDRHGHVIAWNRAIEEMSGVLAADILGKGDFEYALPLYGARRKMLIDLILEPDAAYMVHYEHVQHDGEFLIAETILPRLDGRPVTLMGKAGPLFDQSGAVVGAIESIRDITARVRAEDGLRNANERLTASEERLRESISEMMSRERELRESKERLQTFMDSASDSFMIWDKDLRMVDLNRNAMACLPEGTRKEDLMGRGYAELLPWVEERREQERFQEVVRTGEPFVGTMMVPDASGELCYSIKAFKVGDGLGIAFNDVTAIKRAEAERQSVNERLTADKEELRRSVEGLKASQAALRSSEERFRAFIENISDLTTITDVKGTYLYVSPSVLRLIGRTEDQVLGRNALGEGSPLGAGPEEGRTIIEAARKAMEEPGRPVKIPFLCGRDHGGNTIFLEGILTYLPEVEGVRGLLFHGRDITDRIRVEWAVAESEERYRNIVLNSPYGMHFYELRPDGSLVLTGANPSADRILGLEHGRLVGTTIESAFPSLVGTEVPQRYRLIAQEGGVWMDDQIAYEGGSVIGAFSVTAFQTSAGHMAASFVDITERKRTEEALLERERQFGQLITLLPIPLCLVFYDGRFHSNNNRFHQVFGYTPEDIRTIEDWWSKAYPDERYRRWAVERWEEGLRRARESGEDIEPVEYRITCKDGSVRDVIVSGIAFDQFFMATFIDITDRKRTEDALHHSEEKHRTILENLLDLVYETDIEGRFTMISPSGARMLGHGSPDELIGKQVSDLYANPDDRKAFIEAISKSGSVYGYPLVMMSKDGTHRDVIANSRLCYDPEGNVTGVEGVIHDVTELRRAEDALRTANKKLTLLSGITRHDVKNQLQVLDGYIHLSGALAGGSERLLDLLEKERRASQAIARQLDFMRDYEEIGMRSAVWQDVGALVRNAGSALPLNHVTLTDDCSQIEVYADPLVEKVFYNLIDNSLRYGGDGLRSVRITAAKHGKAVRIVYEDDGAGIDAADRKKLFRKGFGRNTGLGLFLSREILSITGISIAEKSETGKGARFVMMVPAGAWRFGDGQRAAMEKAPQPSTSVS